MREFRVWAPRPEAVALVIDGHEQPMRRGDDGWWQAEADTSGEVDYGFRLDGGPPRPDPRSRRQPRGVHELSRTVDPHAHRWGDEHWRGRELHSSVIYELHIGTFTPAGTFDAAIERLDHLAELGVTTVELLPVNAFNGVHNWGYDGVLWFAIHEPYGGPAGYQRLVDACHQRGLAVIQDVVYNHLGPSGNYLPEFGPYLREDATNTWGAAVNLDGPNSDEVRCYILDNARMWLADYHVDGLRLDAVHALVDSRAVPLLEELVAEVDELAAELGRPLTLIAESDMNNPRLFTPRSAGGYGLTASWNDDFHHALHVAITGETTGYYADFAPLSALAKTLTDGYFHDGSYSSFRGRHHGRPIDTGAVEAWRLVVFAQDHDQIGNRASGDRLPATVDPRRLALAAVLLLTSPFTPMLFMGEEWAAGTPWQFFTSHPEPDLGEKTRQGRFAEFDRHGWDAEQVPDPQDPETFARSKLDWSEPQQPGHREMLALYRDLLALRREQAALTDPRMDAVAVEVDDEERWLVLDRGAVLVAANFSDETRSVPLPGPGPHGGIVLATDPAATLDPPADPTDQPDPPEPTNAAGATGRVMLPGTSAVVLARHSGSAAQQARQERHVD